MREVDEKNEAEEDEDRSSDEGNVISPKHEEAVGDEEADHNEDDPQENLRTPPSVQAVSAVRVKGEWRRTHFGWRPFYLECLEHR